jgi:TonB family protein
MSPRAFLVCVSLILGCSQAKPAADSLAARQAMPDERPVMVNRDLPFHYPGALYARRVQGNVTLRLYIDANGLTVPDSTRVVEPSGQAAFDSAAIAGARDLRFVPAKLHGEPIGMTILFPVYFRHPEAQPLPGDSALKKRGNG